MEIPVWVRVIAAGRWFGRVQVDRCNRNEGFGACHIDSGHR